MECSNWGAGAATKLFRCPGLCHCHSTGPLYKGTHCNHPASRPASRPVSRPASRPASRPDNRPASRPDNQSSIDATTHIYPANKPSSYVVNIIDNLARKIIWKRATAFKTCIAGKENIRKEVKRLAGRCAELRNKVMARSELEGYSNKTRILAKETDMISARAAKIKTRSAPEDY